MTHPVSYPLCWPASVRRTRGIDRAFNSRFSRLSLQQAELRLRNEAHRLATEGGRVVISTDAIRRADGAILGNQQHGDDPGAAVHLVRNGRWYAIACDRFDHLWANLHALELTIAALRAIDRHGSMGLLEQALGGFAALPPARELSPPWYVTLGCERPCGLAEARVRARERIIASHPDRGGDPLVYAAVTDAQRQAVEAFERQEIPA